MSFALHEREGARIFFTTEREVRMSRMMMIGMIAFSLCMSAHAAQFTFERTATLPELNRLTLDNDDDAEIMGFTLTIGDLAKNFDSMSLIDVSAGVTPVLLAPDGINAGLRSDVLSLTFSGFEPGKHVVMKVDIDGDTGSQTTDWQTTLFNNGGVDNAILTVAWEGGLSRSFVLPDDPGRDAMAPYRVSVSPVSVPEPSSLLLLAVSLTLFTCRRFLS